MQKDSIYPRIVAIEIDFLPLTFYPMSAFICAAVWQQNKLKVLPMWP